MNSTDKAVLNDRNWLKIATLLVTICFILIAVYLRTSGLFRGLDETSYTYHPDEAKQIQALANFLQGDYYQIYGSLFYDGYPYGLNHLDEYLLRPVLLFFSPDYPDNPDDLYHVSRFLRFLYSCVILFLCSALVYRLTRNYFASLLPLTILGISPLSVTVAHFATGDIGVDLFAIISLFFLLLYIEKRRTALIFLTGFSIGAAFSAKYNGILLILVPFLFLFFQLIFTKQLFKSILQYSVLASGVLLGIVLFTPNLLIETKPSISNILANFAFIKNYGVPEDILNLPWYAKAMLSLKQNSWTTLSHLGIVLFFLNLLGIVYFIHRMRKEDQTQNSQSTYLLTLALFTPVIVGISLVGKYAVQPFHFSYLQVPLAIVTSSLIFQMLRTHNFLYKLTGVILLCFICVEFGRANLTDNFFWRREDNIYYAQILPLSLYKRSALYTYQRAPIRTVTLEKSGASVFRNRRSNVDGPDAEVWHSLQVAPIPQVAGPVGKNWVFLNGPTFPKNDKSLVIHAGRKEVTEKRYLVLPKNERLLAIGIRSGSFATKARIQLGENVFSTAIDAHQQQLLQVDSSTMEPLVTPSKDITILPLEVHVPHNTIWLSFFTRQKEITNFNLFGGGEFAEIPEDIYTGRRQSLLSAISHIRYLEHNISKRVNSNQIWPLWEVALPAGRYRLTFDVEGIADESSISIEYGDANGAGPAFQHQTFSIEHRLQRFDYFFTKTFQPYQIRFVVKGLQGSCRLKNLELRPDTPGLLSDFQNWQDNGSKPPWLGVANSER